MVPNVTPTGSSFKGASLYYLHDKKQEGERERLTGERVEWTSTRNLATDDPDMAFRVMRATANVLKPLTAGALSAASDVTEARDMRQTLDKINAGSPCEKADALRKIAKEMDLLPSTTLLAEIAPRFFKL